MPGKKQEKIAEIGQKIKDLGKEALQDIILDMAGFLTQEQLERLEETAKNRLAEEVSGGKIQPLPRMSEEFAEEKKKLLESWMREIDEGALYLDAEEYEDYSSQYWDSEWVTEYYDHQGIGDKLAAIIRFAGDCVDDRRYQEANDIYEWLWDMTVSVDGAYETEPVDLQLLAQKEIVHTDMKRLALLTLYADYQVQRPDKRAQELYRYFGNEAFGELHMEDVFRAGREPLTGERQFWESWIALLQTKTGETAGRLLKEAVLHQEGVEGLLKAADENCVLHPSLYLAAMEELRKRNDYAQIEKVGERVLEKIDKRLVIRSEAALKAAYASARLSHTDKVMRFCWECFRADSTDRNFLRLFGRKEMAEQYGMRGREVLRFRQGSSLEVYAPNPELRRNVIGDTMYHILSFYFGDFETVRKVSKNPKGSLGWSGSFIRYGIRLFLLYLYEEPLPSKAAASIAGYIGFQDAQDRDLALPFEIEIIEESSKNHTSTFWSYFQRWKSFFTMSREERLKYLLWAEEIVYGRADAVAEGKHRSRYGEAAALLCLVAEIKNSMGFADAGSKIYQEYKKKFPRHSSFQAQMRSYFGI